MIYPGNAPLRAFRNTPLVQEITVANYDFSAATFAAQVRAYKDAPGSALITLGNASAGSQGISCTYAGTTSTILLQIDEATIDALLPYPTNGVKQGADVVLYWDFIVTGGGLIKTRLLQGTFTIEPGVTV
jgi:hypothetical protein